jgi:hypothetical protein
MSYARLVEEHNRITYANNVKMVAQQKKNPLREAVTITNETGEAVNVADLLGKKDYIEGEDRSRRNPDNPTPASARFLIRPGVIEDGEYIDKERKFDQAMDPTSRLVENSVKTVERGVFDRILGVRKLPDNTFTTRDSGIYGQAREGKHGEKIVPLPSGLVISDAGAGLNLAKLREAQEAMELEDFGLEDDREFFCIITPKQKTDLLNLAMDAGLDLNKFDVEQIKTGKPTTLLGCTWLFSNRVPVVNGKRRVAMWDKDNIVANFWQDIQGDMWNDTSAKNMPYIYTDAYVDATRYEDGGVRFIDCVES